MSYESCDIPCSKHVFRRYTAVVLPHLCLQITAFVSLLALDTMRIEEHRVDCAPCLIVSESADQCVDRIR